MGELTGSWKDASRSITGDDASVLAYIKCIADLDAAGADVTSATVQVLATALRFVINGAADAGITYTGAALAGDVTFADANANSIQEMLNIINGVGVGQTAIRRWRAAIGDFRPGFVLNATTGLAAAAANALFGEHHVGLQALGDSSGLSSVNALAIGIGTKGGTRKGGQWLVPDRFENEYSSTTAGVITPQRSSSRVPVGAEKVTTGQILVRIHRINITARFATTITLNIFDINDNAVYTQGLTAAADNNILFTDQGAPFVMPALGPAFVEITGTGAFTDGVVTVQAEQRLT